MSQFCHREVKKQQCLRKVDTIGITNIFYLIIFLFSFPAAEKKHAEEERRDHECLKNNKQKRINAAAAPDAIKVNALAWPVPTAPAEAEKKLTEVLCLGQSL